MLRFKKNHSFLDQPSFRGLLVFLSIRTWWHVAFESDQNPHNLLKVQTGLPAGLNLYFNLPTANLQAQSGYAYKAVVRPKGVLRFCILKPRMPRSRGRPDLRS